MREQEQYIGAMKKRNWSEKPEPGLVDWMKRMDAMQSKYREGGTSDGQHS